MKDKEHEIVPKLYNCIKVERIRRRSVHMFSLNMYIKLSPNHKVLFAMGDKAARKSRPGQKVTMVKQSGCYPHREVFRRRDRRLANNKCLTYNATAELDHLAFLVANADCFW